MTITEVTVLGDDHPVVGIGGRRDLRVAAPVPVRHALAVEGAVACAAELVGEAGRELARRRGTSPGEGDRPPHTRRQGAELDGGEQIVTLKIGVVGHDLPVAQGSETDELSNDEVQARLQEAARDANAGRIVRCSTEVELRALFGRLRSGQG